MEDIDKDWFFSKLDERGRSLRGLARHLEIDPASASRIFAGKRRMQMTEAKGIADFIGVSVDEVMRHAGIPLGGRREAGGDISLPGMMIVAEIDRTGQVKPVSTQTSIADYMRGGIFDQVRDMEGGRLIGAVVKDSSGPLAFLDDALLLFLPGRELDDKAVGALAIVEPRGAGTKFLARIERARKSGIMTVRMPDGSREDMEVISATPIEIIYP